MRIAPSFLLSMLFFVASTWTQLVAHWPASTHVDWNSVAAHPVALSDVDWMAEIEDDVELELVELTALRVPRTPAPVTLEDRTEVFWPPKPLAVVKLDEWAPPQAHVLSLHNPWPRLLLRPPQSGLPAAGLFQHV